jgi:hypothetical protein
MPISSKRIHLIENDGRIKRVDGQIWESGYWVVGKEKADGLIGGSIFFHAKKASPSYYGGKILSWRLQEDGEYRGRVIFTFEFQADHKDFVAENEGWSQEKKIVMRG